MREYFLHSLSVYVENNTNQRSHTEKSLIIDYQS